MDRLPGRNIWSQMPPDHKKWPYGIINAFDYGTFKMLEDNRDMFRSFDFDKDGFLRTLNRILDKYAPQYGRFNLQELDACIDYYEMRDQKWLYVSPNHE